VVVEVEEQELMPDLDQKEQEAEEVVEEDLEFLMDQQHQMEITNLVVAEVELDILVSDKVELVVKEL
jgi:hypothetical protein